VKEGFVADYCINSSSAYAYSAIFDPANRRVAFFNFHDVKKYSFDQIKSWAKDGTHFHINLSDVENPLIKIPTSRNTRDLWYAKLDAMINVSPKKAPQKASSPADDYDDAFGPRDPAFAELESFSDEDILNNPANEETWFRQVFKPYEVFAKQVDLHPRLVNFESSKIGGTILHTACLISDKEKVIKLVDAGANIEILNKSGEACDFSTSAEIKQLIAQLRKRVQV
jgi:hypothetical protein